MKRKIAAMVLCFAMTFATGMTALASPYHYETEHLYDVKFDCLWLENPTFGELVAFQSNDSFILDDFIYSAAGERTAENFYTYVTFAQDEMNPELVEYWARKGLNKEQYGGENEEDSSDKFFVYSPVELEEGKTYPLLFVNHGGGEPAYQAETFGFCQIAAQEGLILVMAENTETENLHQIYEQVTASYPVDTSRVYVTGSSAGAAASKQFAAAYPELIAAIAPLDASPGIGDLDPEQEEKLKDLGMPMIFMTGTADKYQNYQLGASTFNPNTVEEWNRLLEIQGHEEYKVTPEESQSLISDSLMIMEHLTGTRAEKTEIRREENTRIYVNSYSGESGYENLVYVVTENKGHLPCGFDAEIAWDYLSQFSRDPQTGEIAVEVADAQ